VFAAATLLRVSTSYAPSRRGARRTALFAALVCMAALGACTQTDPDPATPSGAPGDRLTGSSTLVDVDPALLSAHGALSVETSKDERLHLHAAWPRIAEADALNDSVSQHVKDTIAQYRADHERPGDVHAELNVGWRPIAVSPEVVGVVTDEVLIGASAAESTRSFWYDASTAQTKDNLDLVDDAHAFAEAVSAQLTDPDIFPDELAAALSSGPPLMGFTADGGLLVGFDEYQVAPGSAGQVRTVLSPATAESLLSDFGRTARSAATAPTALPAPSTPPDATPDPTPDALPQQTPTPHRVNCAKAKCVALTFDDGPGSYTRRLLKTLDRLDAPAAFFMLGQQVDAFPQTARALARAGHELSVHTWTHRDLTQLSRGQIRSEISRTVAVIEEATGVAPTWFRPPYGATNDRVSAAARRAGLPQVHWSVDTLDWRDRDAGVVTRRALCETTAGSIVLMHDIHETTVEAVAPVVTGLRRKGFTLVSLADLLGSPEPGSVHYRR